MELPSGKRENVFLSSRNEEHITFTRELLHPETIGAGHSPSIEEAHLRTVGAINLNVAITDIGIDRLRRASFQLKGLTLLRLAPIALQ